jgi:Tol biopolymer transport system component
MTDAVANQLTAALAGRYVIERELGHGGMATVYLARDVKHDRPVAVKVLHPDLTASIGAERFLAEIRTTANLQHPHILPLHDSGDAGGQLYYVMPFVEGETLRARLERGGPLPIDDAVRLTCEVLSALGYAHRHGVVHRDIKPANILLHDAGALVADFGIALAVQQAGGPRMTQTGLSLGTPQYMAPEQAMGEKTIDGRADLYAAGAVLYEMLTCEPPFTGPTVQAVVAKVMTERPVPPSTVRDTVPPHVESAVLRALTKLPADRFATAQDFADALADPTLAPAIAAASASTTAPATSADGARTRNARLARYAPWVLAGVLGAALVTLATAAWRRRGVAPVVSHLDVTLPDSVRLDPNGQPTVSPDGSRIYFGGIIAGKTHLFSRTLAEDSAYAIPGIDGLVRVALSPDGRSLLGRLEPGSVVEMSVDGGASHVIMRSSPMTVTWARDGTILYSLDNAVWRANADGSAARRLTPLDSTRGIVLSPSVLPSGDAFLLTLGRGTAGSIAAGRVDGSIVDLHVSGTYPQYVAPGYLLYVSAPSELSAVPFDAGSLRVTGRALPVLSGFITVGNTPYPPVGVSADGRVAAYVRGSPESRLVLVGEGGDATALWPRAGSFTAARFSPDGRRVLLEASTPTGSRSISILDLASGTLNAVAFEGNPRNCHWSPDGRLIAFTRENGADGLDVFEAPANGSGHPTKIAGGPGSQFAIGWTPDGKTLIYDDFPINGSAPRIMGVTNGVVRLLVEISGFTARRPSVSPDGRWIAYQSDELGRTEIFVRRLGDGGDSTGGRWQISLNGGAQAQWSRDGGTLFYLEGGNIMAASVQATKSSIVVSGRRVFAPDRYDVAVGVGYEAAPGGKRLLMLEPVGQARLTVVTNFDQELRQKFAKSGR